MANGRTARTVRLTGAQRLLLINLLWDHRQDGSYWGNKQQHIDMIEKTLEALDPEREFTW